MRVGETVESNDEYSNTVLLRIEQQLPDGSYLVHRHVECPAQYRSEHPDRYLVLSSEELSGFGK